MPATVQKSKDTIFQRRTDAPGMKSPGLRVKILEALKKSKGGTTIEQIAETIGPAFQTKPREIRTEISRLEQELKALIVANVPEVLLPELHDPGNGRIDAQKVADFMGVPLKQLSDGLGLSYKSVHRNPSAAGLQQELRPVKRSLEILHEFFGPDETVRIWLNTPHPDLDGATSLDTILEGKSFAVSRILGNAWNGVPV